VFLFCFNLHSLNAATDLIIPAAQLLEKLDSQHDMTVEGANNEALATTQDLFQTFAHFFQRGSAAERVFEDPHLFGEIAKAAASLQSAQVRCWFKPNWSRCVGTDMGMTRARAPLIDCTIHFMIMYVNVMI
jgi:hypothetical protein